MTHNILISCPHLQRDFHKYKYLFDEKGYQSVLPPVNQKLSEEYLLKIIDQFDGVIAGDDEFTQKVLEKASKLKVISKWGIGLDAIDLDTATKLGIKVYNTPNVFGDEVADLVMGYIILLSRKLHIIDQMVREGLWNEAQIRGISLRDKTLGIIGVGSIGRSVTERAIAAGMNVIGYDIYSIPDSFIKEKGIKQVSLIELLKNSDFISLNCNLTPDNRHLIGKKEFAIMKKGVCIINTARGALIDEKYLINALRKNQIGGAALDVFENEPLSMKNPLHNFQNCIFGAHNSSNTFEAVIRTNELAIKNLIHELQKAQEHE
jgi:D-3-phosphoglycerate dehydrogenase